MDSVGAGELLLLPISVGADVVPGADGDGDEADADDTGEVAGADGIGDDGAGEVAGTVGTTGTVAFLDETTGTDGTAGGADPEGIGKIGTVWDFGGAVPTGTVMG